MEVGSKVISEKSGQEMICIAKITVPEQYRKWMKCVKPTGEILAYQASGRKKVRKEPYDLPKFDEPAPITMGGEAVEDDDLL